jgi:hypothetical protein
MNIIKSDHKLDYNFGQKFGHELSPELRQELGHKFSHELGYKLGHDFVREDPISPLQHHPSTYTDMYTLYWPIKHVHHRSISLLISSGHSDINYAFSH